MYKSAARLVRESGCVPAETSLASSCFRNGVRIPMVVLKFEDPTLAQARLVMAFNYTALTRAALGP